MPVDLTPDGRFNDLNETLRIVVEERNALRAQAQDVEKLYDELRAKDDQIMAQRQLNQRIMEQTGPLQADNTRLREALQEIVERQGRGGLKIAQAALDN